MLGALMLRHKRKISKEPFVTMKFYFKEYQLFIYNISSAVIVLEFVNKTLSDAFAYIYMNMGKEKSRDNSHNPHRRPVFGVWWF